MPDARSRAMVTFEDVVDDYDSSRPGYPPAVYDALGPVDGDVVLDGGAGTGIATRSLLARGARVIPFDIGPRMLRRAVERTPGLPAVIADGARLPFRGRCADLICFAQSWHWLDPDRRCLEAARVLRPNGRWAGWWSHARADHESWFDDHWATIEAACVGTHRSQRDIDWGRGLIDSGLFETSPRVIVPWLRRTTVESWLSDQASHSYVAGLPRSDRQHLLGRLGEIVRSEFPTGVMSVAYETWVWIGRLRATADRASPPHLAR